MLMITEFPEGRGCTMKIPAKVVMKIVSVKGTCQRIVSVNWTFSTSDIDTSTKSQGLSFEVMLRIASNTFSGVMGLLKIRTPSAFATALKTAAGTGFIAPSPIPFAPKGPVGS